jgi:hypothetical protein
METSTLNVLIVAAATVLVISVVAIAVAIIMVGREAFRASPTATANVFGLIFSALPALTTIIFIVVATAVLTREKILTPEGCIAVFSSVASFVLGSETQKRKNARAEARSMASQPASSGGTQPAANGPAA